MRVKPEGWTEGEGVGRQGPFSRGPGMNSAGQPSKLCSLKGRRREDEEEEEEAEPVPGEPEIRRGGNYEFNVPHRPLSMDWKTSPPSLSLSLSLNRLSKP